MKLEYEIDLEPGTVIIRSGRMAVSINSGCREISPEKLKIRIFDMIHAEIANEMAAAGEEYSSDRIEERSLGTIDSFIDRGIDGPMRQIVVKAVHAAGDFSIAPLIRYSEGFFTSMLGKLREGCTIICDSEMVRAGIYSKPVLERNRVVCYLNDIRSKEMADRDGITRSAAGIRIAMQDHENSVIVIGNAPTALWEAMRIIEENGRYDIPVVGIPVGFINASRAKEDLVSSRIEYITVEGHRGGSPIAASIINGFGRFLV